MKTKRMMAHSLAIFCLFTGYFLAFNEYVAIFWCSIYLASVIAICLVQKQILRSESKKEENSKYSIGPCVGADWPVEFVGEIQQHNQVEEISRESALERIKKLREERSVEPPKEKAFVLSPESERKLIEKLRAQDRFRAESWERGCKRVIG